ncbi:MAG: hypothetical protein GY847_35940 [Proteobacteria bacterium]|nr:hypothetical protein [Pseudomonadota bacterium]
MMKKVIRYILYPVLVIGITVSAFSVVYAATNSSIDPEAKWAWSTNAGWINFDPPNGGVMVYDDHLEGYAWGENVGWIRLGAYSGGGAHTYANTSAIDYGVNRTITNTLTGYAWGTNVGWINFSPDGGGVSIDSSSGDFSGYAWGENVGWINFNGSGPVSYKVSMLLYRIYVALVLKN